MAPSPTDHSPNSQSAGKTPAVSYPCHHTEMPWSAPQGQPPSAPEGYFLHPSPPQPRPSSWPAGKSPVARPLYHHPQLPQRPLEAHPHLHLWSKRRCKRTPEAPLPPAAVEGRAPKASQQARLLWPDHSFTSLSSNRCHPEAQAPTTTIEGKAAL